MAVIIKQTQGTAARSAMLYFDNSQSDVLAAGSVVGCSIAITAADNSQLAAAQAVTYTTEEGEGLHDALTKLADKIAGDNGEIEVVPGARGDSRMNAPGCGVLHVRPINGGRPSQGGAWGVVLSTPVFAPA